MDKTLFYIGTYTSKLSKGIYGISMDQASGELSAPELLMEAVSPTYLALDHKSSVLYAASEPTDGSRGLVSAYSIDLSNGRLGKLNEVQAPGMGLCHISVDSSDSWLFGVSYPDAMVQVYPLHEDGSIGEAVCVRQHFGHGPNPRRQEAAHAHVTCLTPDERYLCICDLGLDQVVVYQFSKETGQLEQDMERSLTLPAGCGPRHMVFHPNGKIAYVLTELSSQVFVLSYDQAKGFTVLQTVNALPAENPKSIAAAIRIDSSTRFLYTSNRGEDSISLFCIDSETGLLKHISNTSTRGKHPRDFILDRSGAFLLCANQDTDNIVQYKVSTEDGALTLVNEMKGISMPVCVLELTHFNRPKST